MPPAAHDHGGQQHRELRRVLRRAQLDAHISLDGAYDVEPLAVSAVNLRLGKHADVLLCADQKPGNYLINATYD